ncbi:hypothetical protein [Caudoviricetes sp.]|nr:hypothetical protein [Caudoviricetes sp.]
MSYIKAMRCLMSYIRYNNQILIPLMYSKCK